MEREFYEEYARIQDSHWWFEGRRRILEGLLRGHFGGDAGGTRKILDVGCGTGSNLSVLSRSGTVVGVDTEASAVAVCRERGWDARHATGSTLPFADGEFDLVTLLDVIEHVPDDGELLAEARRVLAGDGAVMVMVPAYGWMWGSQDEIAHHYRRYTRSSLVESLARASLRPDRSSYFNTLLFPPIALIRLIRRLGPQGGEIRSDFEMTRPGRMNGLLGSIFGLESKILPHLDLPFGVSVLAVAGRSSPGDSGTWADRGG